MKILAIETSCDETSIALLTVKDNKIVIHSHKTASQAEFHSQYGGVFPAMAKREHVKAILPVLSYVLDESKPSFKDWQKISLNPDTESKIRQILEREADLANDLINFTKTNDLPILDAIAVTRGPGLEMSLWVGINFARALGKILNIPVVGINHMEGHLVSSILPEETLHKEITFRNIPDEVISLLVSGGHTEIIYTKDNQHKLLGETLDDAVGEAFDKVARLMGLSYPGGPIVSKLAEEAREKNIIPVELPRPMASSPDYNFSYSGLKTAVMYYIKKNPLENEEQKLSLALGFENAAIEVLVSKTLKAIKNTGAKALLLGGGVAANNYLKKMLHKAAEENDFEFFEPIHSITGDNALMIGLAAFVKFRDQEIIDESDSLKAAGMLTLG